VGREIIESVKFKENLKVHCNSNNIHKFIHLWVLELTYKHNALLVLYIICIYTFSIIQKNSLKYFFSKLVMRQLIFFNPLLGKK